MAGHGCPLHDLFVLSALPRSGSQDPHSPPEPGDGRRVLTPPRCKSLILHVCALPMCMKHLIDGACNKGLSWQERAFFVGCVEPAGTPGSRLAGGTTQRCLCRLLHPRPPGRQHASLHKEPRRRLIKTRGGGWNNNCTITGLTRTAATAGYLNMLMYTICIFKDGL